MLRLTPSKMRSEVNKALGASSELVLKDVADHPPIVRISVSVLSTCLHVCVWVFVYYSLAAGGLAAFGVKGDMVISAVCLGEGGYPLKQSGS